MTIVELRDYFPQAVENFKGVLVVTPLSLHFQTKSQLKVGSEVNNLLETNEFGVRKEPLKRKSRTSIQTVALKLENTLLLNAKGIIIL